MHVIFISNCEKKAVARTRSVIDRYATRIGDRAWATPITDQALQEIQRALRSKASRHTSVACYRNSRVQGMRLLWIVGNRTHYDSRERFAVSTRTKKKEMPLFMRHVALVATLAGYCHDLGKASIHFQGKLRKSCTEVPAKDKDAIRHEWLSTWVMTRLLQQSIGDPERDLAFIEDEWKKIKQLNQGEISKMDADGLRIAGGLQNGEATAAWAVCTHHGAIGGGVDSGPNHDKHVRNWSADNQTLDSRWPSHSAAPNESCEDIKRWKRLMAGTRRIASRIAQADRSRNYWEPVLLASRAALILADHKVSSQGYPDEPEGDGILYANTKPLPASPAPRASARKTSAQKRPPSAPLRRMDQPLSWHLQQVGDLASRFARMFHGDDLPCVDKSLVDDVLAVRAPAGSVFAWQDRACAAASGLAGGKLVFNVAGTGAGKTLANLKMAFAMRPQHVRLAVAFNLRSLTTQTFEAYGKHITPFGAGKFRRDFACLIGEGGLANNDNAGLEQDEDASSDLNLGVEEIEGCDLEIPDWIHQLCHSGSPSNLSKLIAAPVLVSTMDWIVACGEPGQQDRHAKALLRASSSDLILDEVDSYDVEATVAVMRVVQTAAAFGRNVIVSSATLNPELAYGLAAAYAQGRRCHAEVSGEQDWHLLLVHDSPAIEPVHLHNPSFEQADRFYREQMQHIAHHIRRLTPTKRYRIAEVASAEGLSAIVTDAALELHEANKTQPDRLRCSVSIGLVRVANVSHCMELAERLRADGRFYVCAYHARDIQERRSLRERWMDEILSRQPDRDWVAQLCARAPWIEDAQGDVRLIVVATPVEEVGRDHDFDWAIIEPSSMHSIIQTAGRVNRHRKIPLAQGQQNVVLLSRNIKSLKKPSEKCFQRPGLETACPQTGASTHPEHDLKDLMKPCSQSAPEAGNDAAHDAKGDAIDASLVFDADGRKTRFAQYDENAVKTQTAPALPIIQRSVVSQGPGRQASLAMGYMLEAYPKKFPLRDGAGQTRVEIDLEKGEFRTIDVENRSGPVTQKPYPDRLWLTPELTPGQPNHMDATHTGRNHVISEIRILWNGVEAD